MPFDTSTRRPTAGQYRAARAILGLSLFEVSRRAEVSVAAVAMIERGRGAHRDWEDAVRGAYERAGVSFLGRGDAELGITLGPPLQEPPASPTRPGRDRSSSVP